MQCSVVIPCHGGAELTRACIDSLLRQQGGHELEILVVDNASPDDTAALAAIDPRVRVLPLGSNRGFAGGVNAGTTAARHPFLLVLNNDTRAAPDLLTRLHAALLRDPRIGIAAPVSNHVKGPACLPIGDRGRDAAGREAVAAELAAAFGDGIEDVETLAGLCLLLHRTTAARIGPFDERFGHGNYEDDDFCLRARLLGLRLVVVRSAFLHHEGHATFRALGLDLPTELQRRRGQFTAKWRHDAAGRTVLLAMQGAVAAAGLMAATAARAWPAWPDADWHRACAAEAEGDHAGAAAAFAAFLQQCPDHLEARRRLGRALLAAGAHREAAALLRQTLAHPSLQPRQAAQLLGDLGEAARARGQLACAADNFAAALDMAPDDAGLANWLGVALLEQGRTAEAIAPLERAARGDCAHAHTNLGICRFRTGELDLALEHFATAVRLLPGDAAAMDNLARAQAVAGRAPAALTPAAG